MPRSRANDTTRERLLREGVDAFLQHGYHGTGLKEVLDRAGVPKGSFYNYFNSKESFVIAAINHYADCLGEKLSKMKKSDHDPLSSLREFFGEQMKEFMENDFTGGCLVANLGGEIEDSAPVRKALQAALDQYRSGIAKTLNDAQQKGQIRLDIAADELARILIDAWEGAVIRMKITHSLAPLEQCLSQMLGEFFAPQNQSAGD